MSGRGKRIKKKGEKHSVQQRGERRGERVMDKEEKVKRKKERK